jgi:hypothetical protein
VSGSVKLHDESLSGNDEKIANAAALGGKAVRRAAVRELAGGLATVGASRQHAEAAGTRSGRWRSDSGVAGVAETDGDARASGGGGERAWQSRGKITGGDAGVDGERSRCHCARRATPVRMASSVAGGKSSAVAGVRWSGGRPQAAAPVIIKQK